MSKCIICNNNSEYFFSKNFDAYDFKSDYNICKSCGFVNSETLFKMNINDWESVNKKYHSYHGKDSSPDDKRWLARIEKQAELINYLCCNGIIKQGKYVDFGLVMVNFLKN